MDNCLFDDILGLSVFLSGEKWCLLNSGPCEPLSSCEEHTVHGKCVYETGEDRDR